MVLAAGKDVEGLIEGAHRCLLRALDGLVDMAGAEVALTEVRGTLGCLATHGEQLLNEQHVSRADRGASRGTWA